MVNVETSIKDGKLTIVVDLEEEHGVSASGKSTTVASTKGNVTIDGTDGIKMGLNVYKPVAR